MYSLANYHLRTGRTGKPLPPPLGSLADNKITFRRGATSLIAGQPGSFKSIMALNMLASWARAGLSAIYFSADTPEFDVVQRMAAILSGEDAYTVERAFQDKRERWHELRGSLSAVSAARFDYQAYDIDGIANRLAAYEAVHGDYPDVVFVDNLINFASSAQDWAGMIDLQNELAALAGETKSHIMVLHHVTDGWPQGVPVPRSAIQGKVTQIPTLVLTVAAVQMQLMVACVKNRHGPQYPGADVWLNFQVHHNLQVEDVERERIDR